MDKQHFGSCLCGEVRFTLAGGFENFFLCHCAHCRKGTGSAHAANLFSSTARLEWISGRDKLGTYNLPQTRHTRCFCSICGSAMPFVSQGMIVVPAGCLDTDSAPMPDAHIFVASRAPWDHDLEHIPAFDTLP
jgi:hypothetical protein